MRALAFWKAVAVDQSDFLEGFLAVLEENRFAYCLIGGQAVNAYAEPVVSLDLDVVLAVGEIERAEALLRERFRIERFAHSLNVSAPGSRLRIQIQTDPRYAAFVDRAQRRDVLDLALPVAAIEDVLAGKIWAVQDETRRPSKRQKDLADIARLLEVQPALKAFVPADVLARLFAPGV
jgi:hypothetical protein